MAKTINELSYKYASDFMKEVDKVNAEQRKWLERHKDETPPSGGVKACFIFQRSAYEAGANAVLEEIEQLMSKFDRNPGYRYNDLYVRMKDKIRELKGG